ncbi:uncharacterized protein LOC132753327 [Ruditapes philippinarum]|uniref:uncharacterized protein LOC132753327 n=1 Tax=Ruditapes philippinarum TaxID=129788 RepID=UPI00295AF139|nr:uncharacterized protein LOC132753327 [Ruditapes philippinarum]
MSMLIYTGLVYVLLSIYIKTTEGALSCVEHSDCPVGSACLLPGFGTAKQPASKKCYPCSCADLNQCYFQGGLHGKVIQCNCSGSGFTGCNCETNIDDCASSPCLYRGTCNDGINYYNCTCLPGFRGENCEIALRGCDDLQPEDRVNGEYVIYNSQDKPYKVYCEFHASYGYTFILKKNAGKADLNRLRSYYTEVLVRHLRSNGHQYDTTMEQISTYSSLNISIQYNANIDYKTPINSATWGSYLYVGFLPISIAASKSTQGYRANGNDFTFSNCDSNPNSYLALFVNHNNNDPNGKYKKCCYKPLMRFWIEDAANQAPNYIPCNYFYQFEMHMGGCGGYAINGYNTLDDIVGAALGFRFDI